MATPYLVAISQLVRNSPATMSVTFDAPFDEPREFEPRGAGETDVAPDAPVRVNLRLESFSGGLRATGTVAAPWFGFCRRCSKPIEGQVEAAINERFVLERGPEDDLAYLYEHDEVDLAPLVHDAVFLELPLAPVCRDDCRGLCPYCGIDRNEASCDCRAPSDSRWATLDGLRFADESDESSTE